MILQEKIQKKAEGYGKLAPVFLEGAKFALENQWISVDDDLPCNHEELIENENYTKNVLVVLAWNDDPSKKHIEICDMCNKIGSFNTNWYWQNTAYYHVVCWKPLPELSKEQEIKLWKEKKKGGAKCQLSPKINLAIQRTGRR